MASKLEVVPPEILERIAEILDVTHPPSLIAFARANKGCYIIAKTLIYRTIRINIGEGQPLVRDVGTLEKMLQRDDSFASVHRLILLCKYPGTRCRYTSLSPCERKEDDTEIQGCWDLYCSESYASSALTGRIADRQWQRLAGLVRQLPGLTDLFWASPKNCQFPPSMLQALHEDLPQCRLHHFSFHRRELDGNSHDLAVARSSCLYSLGDIWQSDHTMLLAAVQRFQPPRLKRIYLYTKNSGILWDAYKTKMTHPLLLEHIQLGGPESFRARPPNLVSTRTFGDVSALRVLRLDIDVSMRSLPPPQEFHSLITLDFTCRINSKFKSVTYWDDVAFFVRHLPCLSTLQLRGWSRHKSIGPCLGKNLRNLDLSTHRQRSLFNPLSEEILHQIVKNCPRLESLAVEVRRTRGDMAEVARYRTIGRLLHLRHLDLTLDAGPPGFINSRDANGATTHHDTKIESWFDKEDKRYLDGQLRPLREGHAKDFLINSAVDASLARSIFEVIDGAKAKKLHKPVLVPLERLTLRVTGASAFSEEHVVNAPDGYVWPFLTAVKRTWLVERDVRDDARDVIHVLETKPWRRTSCLEIPRVEEQEKSPRWMAIWRRHDERDRHTAEAFSEMVDAFREQAYVLKRVHHDDIVTLFEGFTTPMFIGIVIGPVARCSLEQFEAENREDDDFGSSYEKMHFLANCFGCLGKTT